jgi:catechol 2,3-dioxygenase-like lactoylglutathione lyase family enzyme
MDMPSNQWDRRTGDLGNSVEFGHVNVTIPSQLPATAFYVSGLGLTRDPYLMTGIDNMWVNLPNAQFHLPRGNPQVLRGHTGIVVPDLKELLWRLDRVKHELAGTQFRFEDHGEHVDAWCPWGNHYRLYAPDEARFGRLICSIPYVQFDVPRGTAPGIVRFYEEVLGMPGKVDTAEGAPAARVQASATVDLIFHETDKELPPFDGHHIQITLVNFSGPYRKLLERGLISQEDNEHQYRFLDIVDVETNKPLFRVEHEVRSMRNPLYARTWHYTVRNPRITNQNFIPGREAMIAAFDID